MGTWSSHLFTDLPEPTSVIQHFKLQQHFGKFVEVLDDLLGLGRILQKLLLLLEYLHGLLDPPEQLTGPRDFTWNTYSPKL